MKRLALLISIILILCAQIGLVSPAHAESEYYTQTKEINFVFLHGAGGTSCDMQVLSDNIMEQIPLFINVYEEQNPSIKITFDSLSRCYPSNVDVNTWAKNIASAINTHFTDKKNLVLIGHSMGGKAALYAVARNTGNIASKVAVVVTINSPIKSMQHYYITGGNSLSDFCRARWLIGEQGLCQSVAYYNSATDGMWVSSNKHWLALISGESAPSSGQFDFGGIDAMPRSMDDSAIPISAQYAQGADIIYYGEYSHSALKEDAVAAKLADYILRYIFGRPVDCSVFTRSGDFEHNADWVLGTDYWEDIVGEILVGSGSVQHTNESYFKCQEWEDVVGEDLLSGEARDRFEIEQVTTFPLLARLKESNWFTPGNPQDSRLYIQTSAAPRNSVQIDWSIYRKGLLPVGTERDRYEIEITTGTPFTNIREAKWANTQNFRDVRLRINSEAESPFRWFKAEWSVFAKETRVIDVISELVRQPL